MGGIFESDLSNVENNKLVYKDLSGEYIGVEIPTGLGDMLKSQYDINDNGIVDNSERLGGQSSDYYAKDSDLNTHILNLDNPHNVTKLQLSLENVDNIQQLPLSYLDTDSSFTANSDIKVASQKAIKTALDNKENIISPKNTAFNQNFETSTSNIKMDGIVSVGISNNTVRADHVHASDTSKANDNAVVHLTGDEIISGNKTFLDQVYEKGTYGEIYIADNTSSQSIPNGTSYTKVTIPSNNGLSSNCTPNSTNSEIVITKTGKYKAEATFCTKTNTNNITLRTCLFLNGVEQSQIHGKRFIQNSNQDSTVQIGGLINVTSVPMVVDIRTRHDGISPVNIIIEYGNLNLTYVGE